MAESYEKAGVNLEAGYEVVRRIKKHVASTARTGAVSYTHLTLPTNREV